MVQRIKKHGLSIQYAWDGIRHALKNESNFQLELVIGGVVFVVALLLGVDTNGLSLLLFTAFLVLICEMVNTAIEEVVDLATQEWKMKAKIAKDVAAGAALLSAICSVGVGLLVLLPYILKFIS